jgi:UDP-N-acetylmuramate--alanine ligase
MVMFQQNKEKIKVHFIGVGGIGMSGLAQVLVQLGYKVSGSDLKESSGTLALKNMGIKVFYGHARDHIQDPTVVVYSSAVSDENPEMLEAKKRKIPIIRRAEMLAELMRLKFSLAVAGTHGKTTTTSFLGTIFYESDYDPTLIIGGVVSNLGGNARVGSGDVLVAEADESDGSFLLLRPVMCALTNIDDDHLDFYQGHDNLIKAFREFVNSIPFYGVCSLNIHDRYFEDIKKTMKRPFVTYGLETLLTEKVMDVDYLACAPKMHEKGVTYDLYFQGKKAVSIDIALRGEHNILNSLAAISLAHQFGVSFDRIRQSIIRFKGVGRRFETLLEHQNLMIVDDYAHHPTEIATTLKAARSYSKKKLVVIFEPHRFTRTQSCWTAFLHCFNLASEVYLAPIYPASEREIPGVTSQRLVEDMNQLHPHFAHELMSLDVSLLKEMILKYEHQEVMIFSMGAGSIGKKIREVVNHLKVHWDQDKGKNV